MGRSRERGHARIQASRNAALLKDSFFRPAPARGVCFLGRGRRRADGEMARRHVKKMAFFEMSPYPYDFSGENCFGNSIA